MQQVRDAGVKAENRRRLNAIAKQNRAAGNGNEREKENERERERERERDPDDERARTVYSAAAALTSIGRG